MKQSIGFCGFCDAFRDADRNTNFSYEGKQVLFDYLEEYEESTGEEIELDVIALCCEYSEDTWEDIASDYSIDLSECEDDEEKEEAIGEYLNENTMVCGTVSGGFVYAKF
jgi:predicted ArsR family transcriptional regulator